MFYYQTENIIYYIYDIWWITIENDYILFFISYFLGTIYLFYQKFMFLIIMCNDS